MVSYIIHNYPLLKNKKYRKVTQTSILNKINYNKKFRTNKINKK